MVIIALGLVLVAPLFEGALSKLTGFGLGPLFTATAFIVVARMALRPPEARRPQITPASPLGPGGETPLSGAVS
jgi:hypothetical protein